jgi:hypothetical protein
MPMSRNESASVRPDAPIRRVGIGLAVLATGLVLIVGCEGENIFVEGIEDTRPPRVEILEPLGGENVAPNDSVLVRAHVRDGNGVQSVVMRGVAVRGDAALGTETEIVRLEARTVTFERPVRDTTITRYLRSTDEPGTDQVLLMVSATDAAGNVGADTVEVGVGGPSVTIRTPTPGQVIRSGTQVPVEIHARDPDGVNLIAISYAGAMEQTVQFVFAAVQDTVLRTTLTGPATLGELAIRALARNTDGVTNESAVVRVEVASATQADNTAPRVGVQTLAPPRVELTDSIRVRVTARDEDGGTGVARVEFTALARSAGAGVDLVWHAAHSFPSARTDQAVHEFAIPIDALYATVGANFAAGLALPEALQFEVHAIAVDAAGNCAAATGTALAQGPCGTVTRNGVTVPVAANAVGQRADVTVVAGRTISLSGGGVIADAVVDRNRRQLYLSNFSRNRVEKLDLQTLTFHPGGIHVGAQPWGLFLDRSGDSLIVANSGGTNIDYVPLNAAGLAAGVSNRLQTPNILLFQVNETDDEASGARRYTVTWHDFSDRPQFVAQDAAGRLLYSTVPTGSAPDGTVRVLWREPGWERLETQMLLTDVTVEDEKAFAVANVDWVGACTTTDMPSGIAIVFRVPGSNTEHVTSCTRPGAAFDEVTAIIGSAQPGLYVQAGRAWDLARIGWSDTTFVAASGNRNRIAFGEGAANTGRILMWDAATQGYSGLVSVADLIHNEPARITGIDLNQDGRLGLARGTHGAYFFGEDLRLYGRAVDGVGGGAGAALHPSHSGTGWGPSPTGLSFVGTNRNSIQILDVGHFTARGEIPIRDQVVGPLRVSLPLAGDPADTVVRIYAVTSAGGVVLVRVRTSDITS